MVWPIAWAAVAKFIPAALDLLGQNRARNDTKDANNQQIQLTREQMQWEEMMSNTAVQRRADDIQKAGGNRALAFTNGQEASTPNYTPAKPEPLSRAGDYNFAAKALAAAQIQNLQATTAKTSQEARVQKIIADAAERQGPGGRPMGAFRYDTENLIAAQKLDTGQIEQEIKKLQRDMSAQQLAQFTEMMPILKQTAETQMKAGKLDYEALENIAKAGGLEAGKMQWLISLVIRLVTKD